MPSVHLRELHYTKADLASVPKPERNFFLMATGLANDLQTLYKMFALAVADDRDELIVKQANSSVGMLMLRLLAGRLWEGRNLLERTYRPIEDQYKDGLSNRASGSLSELRCYFAQRGNLINTVRNKIGFHADSNIVNAAFDRLPDDADMGDYFSTTVGNTLYYSTEMLHFEAVNGFTGLGDQRLSLQRLVTDIKTLTISFNSFVYGFVRVFLERHLGKEFEEMYDRQTILEGIPNMQDLGISYFMVVPVPGESTPKAE